jgi:hypothetical protein
MNNQSSTFTKILVAYCGLIQSAHILALTRSYTLLRQSGEITFLAQPPSGGWSLQAEHFLISLGAIDFVNALLVLVFVYGYFSRARWWYWLGTVTLTVSIITALVYAYGTIASGAWGGNLVEYLILLVLFTPVGVLYILFGIWGVNGKGGEGNPSEPSQPKRALQ